MAGTDGKWSWPHELPPWGQAKREVRREDEIVPGRDEPPEIFPEDVRPVETEDDLKRILRVISQGVDNWFPNDGDESGRTQGVGRGGGGGGGRGGRGSGVGGSGGGSGVGGGAGGGGGGGGVGGGRGTGGGGASNWGSLGKRPPQPPRDIDACAWYYSFRYPQLFGIYICVQCLAHFEYVLRKAGASRKVASSCAFRFLYRHELFHYRVDRAVETLEAALEIENGFPVRLWFRKRVPNRFNPSGKTIELLEEACANLDGWKAAYKEAPAGRGTGKQPSQRDIVKKALAQEMLRMPAGYRDFDAVDRPHTRIAHATLVSQYVLIERAHKPGPPALPDIHLGLRSTIPLINRGGPFETDPDVPLFFVDC